MRASPCGHRHPCAPPLAPHNRPCPPLWPVMRAPHAVRGNPHLHTPLATTLATAVQSTRRCRELAQVRRLPCSAAAPTPPAHASTPEPVCRTRSYRRTRRLTMPNVHLCNAPQSLTAGCASGHAPCTGPAAVMIRNHYSIIAAGPPQHTCQHRSPVQAYHRRAWPTMHNGITCTM